MWGLAGGCLFFIYALCYITRPMLRIRTLSQNAGWLASYQGGRRLVPWGHPRCAAAEPSALPCLSRPAYLPHRSSPSANAPRCHQSGAQGAVGCSSSACGLRWRPQLWQASEQRQTEQTCCVVRGRVEPASAGYSCSCSCCRRHAALVWRCGEAALSGPVWVHMRGCRLQSRRVGCAERSRGRCAPAWP